MDVDEVADELYALAPGDFTARRDALVKQARAGGDRTSAAGIAALRKPTVVAWLANQLARRNPEEIAPLLELGQALREATLTLSGPELRRLSSQRQQLVHALVTQARLLGQNEGHRVTEDAARGLEDTFHAALADPSAAQALAAGRLVVGLSRHGFGDQPALAGPKASPAATRGRPADPPGPARATKPTAAQQQRARERSRLEQDLGEAWGQARRAADARDKAATDAEQAQRVRADAEREAARLRGELEAAEADLSEAAGRDDDARRARDAADQEAQEARQHVAELQRRLDGLQGS
jgi:hypothetical protein